MVQMKMIGERMRTRREELGLIQADIARVVGVSRVNYSKYESGHIKVSATDIDLIADALKVPVSYFYDDVQEDYDEHEVLAYYRGVPPTLKKAAKAALKALFEQQDREETAHGKHAG